MESVGSLIAYAAIALTIVVCSVLAVTTRKILRAATFLLFALFGTAAAYFMLDYQFLGGVQIAVYAGGIVVLVVFAILLTSNPGSNSPKLASKKRVIGVIGAIATFIIAAWALLDRVVMFTAMPEIEHAATVKEIGVDLIGSGHGQYLLPFEAISVLLVACIIGGIVVARKKNDD